MQRARVLRLGLAALAVAPALLHAQALSPYHAGPPDTRSRYEQLRYGATVEEWARRLESENPKERLGAIEDLGRTEDSRAVTYLLKATADADLRVQARAIEFLGARRSAEAIPVLTQKLFLTGAPAGLRQRVLTALGRIGDPSASRSILDFLGQEPDPDVRGTGIYALGEIADQSVRPDLQKLGERESDPRLKRLVDEALYKMATLSRPADRAFVPPSSAVVPPLRPGQ